MVFVTSKSAYGTALVGLKSSGDSLVKAFEKVASGKRINSSSDDAAGLSVSTKIINQIKGIEAGINTSQTAISTIETALSGISSASDIALRLYELAVQASNGTYTPTDREMADLEAISLKNEFLRVAENTKLNEKYLLDGTFSKDFQVGTSIEEIINITIPGIAKKNELAASVEANVVDRPTLIERSEAVGTSRIDLPELSEVEITEAGKIATGNSSFDTPSLSQANNVSVYDLRETTEASASSNFDTPSNSTASGSSSISILGNNAATVITTNYNNPAVGTSLGTSNLVISSSEQATVSSALNYLANSPVSSKTSAAAGVPASSLASVGTASSLSPLNYYNADFSINDSASTPAQSGTTVSIPGWNIELKQVSLDSAGSNSSIGGYSTPTPALGSASDATSITGVAGAATVFSYTDSGNELTLKTNDITTSSNGAAHGPYVISDEAIFLNAGDTFAFDWESTGVGGDYTDVYAYLLDTATGATVTLLDFTSTSSGAVAKQTVSKTLAGGESGMYKFVYISGAYDSDGGGIVGSETKLSNITVTEATPGSSTTTAASVTIEARESGGVTINRNILATLDNVATNNAGIVNPYTITGTDAAYFSIDQSNGNITSTALSRATKSSYSFAVTYQRSDGGNHTENVTLNLKAALGATTTLSAQEGAQVNIALSDLALLNEFATTPGNTGGTFSLDPASADLAKFSINPGTGAVTSLALDYDTQQAYNFKVLYSINGETFENTVVLNLTDTLDSSATATAEEADNIKLLISSFTSSETYKTGHPGNAYSITGTDAGKFTFDANGDIISTQGLYLAEQQTYRFNLEYIDPVTANKHVEAVTLSLTQSLESNSTVYVDDNAIATINPNIFNNISRFASGEAGTWSHSSNAIDPSDHSEFSMPNTSTGVISSNAVTNQAVENRFDFDLTFTKASDSSSFTESITVFVRDPSIVETTLTAEETALLTINRDKFSNIDNAYNNVGSNGSFSLTGANAGRFSISNTGVVSASNLTLQGSRVYNFEDTYNFDVNYAVNGTTYTEKITLKITEALQSNSSLKAAESQSVSLNSDIFGRLNAFAARDRYRGSYSLDGYGDNGLFNMDASGNLTSKAALEFNDRADHKYNLKLLYTAFDNRVFTDYITLTLTDTFSSTSTISVEESEEITIPISNLSTTADFKSRYVGGQFSLSGTDAAYFDVDTVTGDIVSKAGQQVLRSVKSSYDFNLIYSLSSGIQHTDQITLTPTEALQSTDSATSQEGNVVNIFIDRLLLLRQFASRDGNGNAAGWAITGADGDLFKFNALGNIESKAPIIYGARGDNRYNFSVSYTETLANGSDTFTAQVALDITETFSSTATVSAVEGKNIKINLEDLHGSYTYSNRHEGGQFSLSGSNGYFVVDPLTGNITSTPGLKLLRSNQSSHTFQLQYLDLDGNTHTETITLNLEARDNSTTATARAQEAGTLNLDLNKLVIINDFAESKSWQGNFHISGTDAELFEIFDNRSIRNIMPIDHSDRGATPYYFNVIFEAGDGAKFSEAVTLYISDTLSSSANLESEEAVITAIKLERLTGYSEFKELNPGGTIHLSGTDANFFLLDQENNQIISKEPALSARNYDLSLNYRLNDRTTFIENINLLVSASTLNKSTVDATAAEAKELVIDAEDMFYINRFAARDGFQGKFKLKDIDSGENISQFFTVDKVGNITSHPEFLIDFEKGKTEFELLMDYQKADGSDSFESRINIRIQNDPIDDYYLNLPLIDLTTIEKAESSVDVLRDIIVELTSTEVKLGALKNQLTYNISYQYAKAMNSKVAVGRINDADMAKELTNLIKLGLLNNASNSMLANTMSAKRVAAQLLFDSVT